MQATHECCAFKNSERPPFPARPPWSEGSVTAAFAKTHSSSQHEASMVQRKQEWLWSQGEAPPVPPVCTLTTPGFQAYSPGPNPGTRPALLSRAFPSPRWSSEATRAPEPSLGAWIPRPLAKLLRHCLEGSVQPMAGRQQELGPCHLSPPRLQPAHLIGPAQKPRAGLGPRQACRALWVWASGGHRQGTQKVAGLMSIYRQGHMTE